MFNWTTTTLINEMPFVNDAEKAQGKLRIGKHLFEKRWVESIRKAEGHDYELCEVTLDMNKVATAVAGAQVARLYIYVGLGNINFPVLLNRQRNSKEKRCDSMNSVQIWRKKQKKAERPRITLRPRPDQEPAIPNANRSIRQDRAEKRHNLTGHSSPKGYGINVFTWSVLDVFAVKCEQFSISHCHY